MPRTVDQVLSLMKSHPHFAHVMFPCQIHMAGHFNSMTRPPCSLTLNSTFIFIIPQPLWQNSTSFSLSLSPSLRSSALPCCRSLIPHVTNGRLRVRASVCCPHVASTALQMSVDVYLSAVFFFFRLRHSSCALCFGPLRNILPLKL